MKLNLRKKGISQETHTEEHIKLLFSLREARERDEAERLLTLESLRKSSNAGLADEKKDDIE